MRYSSYHRHCVFLFLVLGLVPGAGAESPGQLIVQWDNDLLTGTDHDYTNGARIAYLRDFMGREGVKGFPRGTLYGLSGENEKAPFRNIRFRDDGTTQFAWGIGVTQLMYTPDNPAAPSAPPGERPYAGWLGGEMSLHAKNENWVSSVTLSIGTTGDASRAAAAQKWVHENISDSPIFQGWDTQVPAEPTVNLFFDQKRRIPQLEKMTARRPFGMDGYYEWGAGLGTFRTDAYVGALMRAGFNLPATYATPRVQLGSYGHALFRKPGDDGKRWSALVFGGVRGSAVFHDITLDGTVFRGFDTGVESEPFVGELITGVAVRVLECEVSLSHTFRSREFEGQRSSQEFGSVMLRTSLPF